MAKMQKYALMALKKKSPKVPNYTCTDIDNIITTLEKLHDGTKKLTKIRLDVLERKLERLRSSNEALRDSGIYWYGVCKKIIKSNNRTIATIGIKDLIIIDSDDGTLICKKNNQN